MGWLRWSWPCSCGTSNARKPIVPGAGVIASAIDAATQLRDWKPAGCRSSVRTALDALPGRFMPTASTSRAMSKTGSREFLRGLPHRPGDQARHPAHHHGGRRRALQRPVRPALCGAVLGRVRACGRLSARAGRRPAGLPHGVRQDRARHLAQCRRQSRLRRLPVPGAGLSRRHAQRRIRGDRAQGEFEPQDRHRVRALDRLQAGRQQGAGIRALGDGAKARRGGCRRPGDHVPRLPEAVLPGTLGDACPRIDVDGLRFRARRQRASLRRLRRSARGSTTSTA